MNNPLIEIIGLTAREASLYEVLLRFGECTPMSLVKETQTHPQIVYRALDALTKRGLAQFVIRGSKKLVRAEDPDMLEVIEERRLREIKKAIPKLRALSKTYARDDTTIRVARGADAIRLVRTQAIDQLERVKQPLCIIGGSGDRFFEVVGVDWYIEHEKERIQKKVRKKLITFENQRELLGRDRFREYSEYRYLPEHHAIPSSTNIFNSTVAIFIWSADPAVIVINSREVAESYMSYFESLWHIAKS